MSRNNEKYVFLQKPNLPIIVWFSTLILGKIITTGSAHQILSYISSGALFTWAWLEIFHGVNNFRRLFGAVVLIGAIINHARIM